jgi:hypothetical protein
LTLENELRPPLRTKVYSEVSKPNHLFELSIPELLTDSKLENPPRMDRLTIFTTFFFFALINALPIPNYADRLVWANAPDTRGTLTIVFSCGTALLLCIWSGIHSNVNPSDDDGEKKGAMSSIAKVVGKAALASIALLAPDIVLTVALHQLLVALQYQKAINPSEVQKASTNGLGTTRNSDGTEANVKADAKLPEASAMEVGLGASLNGDRTDIAVTTDEKLPTTSIKELDASSNDATATTPDPVTTDEKIQKSPTTESIASEYKTSPKPTKADTRPPNGRNYTGYSSTSNDIQVTESTGAYDKLRKTITGLTTKSWTSQKKKNAGHVGLKMSFFATMGGFCFSETTLKGYHRRSLGFDTLLHPNTMDIIQAHPLSDIEDKSKASGIAKTVAVIQVGWVLLQCLGRYLEKLHITLLELNTCVHVVLAIVTYGIWMRKPLDVDVSIPAESNKLIHDFATAVYMDDIRSPLREAEEHVMRGSKRFVKFISDADKPPTTNYVASKHPKILVAMILSQGMREVAEEAGRMFYASHAAVKSSMARETIGNDIKLAVINKYLNEDHGVGSELRHLKFRDAAFESTSNLSSKLAHDHTHITENFTTAIRISYKRLRNPKITDADYRKILNAEIQPVMHKALAEIRAESMKSSFDGAISAAQNVVGDVQNQQKNTISAIAQSALACCRAAARRAVLHEALKAAIGIQNAGDAVEAALHKFRNKCYPRAPDSNAEVKNSDAVVRDSDAEIIPGSDAVARDLGAEAQNSHAEVRGSDENDLGVFDTFFAEVVDMAKEQMMLAFGNYIKIVGFERDTNISVTADIVSRYAARGILFAVEKAIANAKDDVLNSPNPSQPIALESSDAKTGTQVEVTAQSFTKDELASMGRDCEDALCAILNSKTWRMINPDIRHSIWANIKYPFANAAGVLRNQLVDVPELFTPFKPERMSQYGGYSNDCHNGQHFNKPWRQEHRIVLLAISTIVGIFYGAIHITKWNSMWFPTPTEHLLWNISCCVGSVAVLPIGLSMLIPFQEKRSVRRGVCIALCTVSWVLFGAARVYFVVESFLSIRSLPGSAYRSVQWLNTLPHF